MKQLVTAMFAGAMLAGSIFAASAGEAEGIVESIDMATRTIVLADGSSWTASEAIDIAALAPGDTIRVTYEDGTTTLSAAEKVDA